jgi:hypothetical protein
MYKRANRFMIGSRRGPGSYLRGTTRDKSSARAAKKRRMQKALVAEIEKIRLKKQAAAEQQRKERAQSLAREKLREATQVARHLRERTKGPAPTAKPFHPRPDPAQPRRTKVIVLRWRSGIATTYTVQVGLSKLGTTRTTQPEAQ